MYNIVLYDYMFFLGFLLPHHDGCKTSHKKHILTE